MFELPKEQSKFKELPLIDRDYSVHLLDEMPILFTGTNKFNSHIIGTSVDEDYTVGVEWYFHIIVTDDDYFAYIRREISYYLLLKKAGVVYVVEKTLTTGEDKVYEIAFDDIPDEYMPLESSYFPLTKYKPSVSYETSFEGKLAADHLAVPSQVNKTQASVTELTENAAEWLKELYGLVANTYLKPAPTGCFKISYEIKFQPNLFIDTDKCQDYINKYIEYCLTDMPKEARRLAETQLESLEGFNRLFDLSHQVGVLSEVGTPDTQEEKEQFAYNIFNAATVMRVLSQDVGGDYNEIVFSNIAKSGNEELTYPLGKITSTYKSDLEEVSSVIEEVLESLDEKKSTTDDVDTWYEIYVDSFHVGSGKGMAKVINDQQGGRIDHARIRFVDYPYRDVSSAYTKALDSRRKIKVLAKATRDPNGRIIRIDIVEG